MTTLTLYGRAGCHLCEEMKAELAPFRAELGFQLREVDVGWEGELARRYGSLLPLLMRGDQEVCRYHLDPARLRACLL